MPRFLSTWPQYSKQGLFSFAQKGLYIDLSTFQLLLKGTNRSCAKSFLDLLLINALMFRQIILALSLKLVLETSIIKLNSLIIATLLLFCLHIQIKRMKSFKCKLTVLFSFLILFSSCRILVYPPPKEIELSQTEAISFASLCFLSLGSELQQKQINYQWLLKDNLQYYWDKIMTRVANQQQKVKYTEECKEQISKTDTLTMQEPSQILSVKVNHKQLGNKEAYQLIIQNQLIQVNVQSYSGYVYAMETLSQLIAYDKQKQQYSVPRGTVKDQPLIQYRGIMIDSVRHFLSVTSIQKLLETMSIFKLNTLHWHLVDDQAFPIKLSSHPELSQGAYSSSEVYTISDIIKLLAVASKNGIQIVPQIDTPAHVRSWGLSNKWKNQKITVTCPGGQGYNGQFNVSNTAVWTLTEQVIKEVAGIFKDSPYFHLGGDQVSSKCWDSIPEIKKFMEDNNLKTYGQLQMYWRSELKKHLPEGKKVIFWRNNADGVNTDQNDILHYWGAQNETNQFVKDSTSKIIMSQLDYLYLNLGQGFIWGNQFGHYTIWKQLYKNLKVFPDGVDKSRILGSVACLWGQVSNQDTLENNLWMRAAAFSYRIWSQQLMNTVDLVTTLVKAQKTLQGMGVSPSPVTTQFCQINTKACFQDNQQQDLSKFKESRKMRRSFMRYVSQF